MHRPSKSLSLVTTTLLLSLASPVYLKGISLEVSDTPAQAQTTQDRKAQADRLAEQGNKQLNAGQLEPALQSLQQALTIYRELQDRQGEGQVLKNLGNVYYAQKDYAKAIESQQQALAIAREIRDRDLEGRALNNLGLAYKELGDSAKAIEYYQQALAIAREIHNRKLEQIALNNLGFTYVGLGNPATVVEYYQQVLAIARELKERSTETSALAYLGDASASLNNNQKAIEFAQQALGLARETKNSSAEALALDTLSRSYSSLGDAQKTLEFAQQGLVVARQIKNNFFEVRALARLGDAYAFLNQNQKAIEFAQQALALARETKNSWAEAIALDTLTRSYSSLEEPQKVLEFGQASLAVARQIKNNLFEWRALVFLCKAHYSLGNSQQAVEFAQQSLTLARESKNRTLESGALSVLSGVYGALRDYQKAIELAQQSLVIAREIRNCKLESTALYTLGGVYWALRDYQKGIEYSQQALAIYRELKDRGSELEALHQLNINYIYLGDYQKAIELNQQVLALAREIKNHDYEGIALGHLGFAYFAQGDSQKIIEYGQQALSVGRESKSPIAEFYGLFNLSIGYGNLGNNEKALEYSQSSLAIARTPKFRQVFGAGGEPFALNILGSIYSNAGQKEQAIAVYRESLAIDDNDFTAQVGLARTYRDLNMPITAITYYKQAIGRVEQIRGKIIGLPQQLQESFLQAVQVGRDRSKNTDIYRELADLLLSQGRILEAQQVVELLKVEELRDFTGNRRAGGKTKETAFTPTEEKILQENGSLIAFGQRLYECQQSQCSQLSQLLDQRQGLTEQFNQKVRTIEKEVRSRRAQDDAFFDPTKLAKAKEIVEAQPATVLIYPFVLEDKIWLLWTSKGGVVKSVEVPVGRRQLGETVLKFRQLLQNPSSDITEVKTTSKQLYDWLIKPIEPELKANQIQNLVFSLDSVTRYIPMSALFDGEKYLVENYAVSTVLSADLTDMRDRLPPGTQNTSVLALGLSNAVAGFNPLPNVPAELDAIVRQNPSAPQGIYSGLKFLNNTFDFRALRDNLLGHKVLHIATHGEFVPGRQEESYLLLGTGEKLTIPQVKTLQDLSDVHLVVLSACQTALGGPDQDGVEISGLSYYFLNSGAKAVMASLWLVSDDSTRLLMQSFYGNLAKQTAQAPMTKAAALQQAQLSLLHGNSPTGASADNRSLSIESRPGSPIASTNSAAPGFSHPYYWAPFILIGNGL